jgi:hypothetical protein
LVAHGFITGVCEQLADASNCFGGELQLPSRLPDSPPAWESVAPRRRRRGAPQSRNTAQLPSLTLYPSTSGRVYGEAGELCRVGSPKPLNSSLRPGARQCHRR